ncbi:MAG: hypothetical protein R2834_12335 [Rhodothermales bacterium]
MNYTFLALTFLLLALPARAQTPPAANPEDVATVDAIMAATYDVISGPIGEERNWDRFRSLFIPGARLIPVSVRPEGVTAAVSTVDEYIQRASPYFVQNGFFEVEVERKIERYGHILHAFSTYESRSKPDDAKPFARGINSFQLLWDGSRWWIVTIYWDSERPDQPIPERYLPRNSP